MSVPRLGQQGFQHGLRRLLVQAVLGVGLRRAEGLLEEGHAHAFGAADLPQRRRGPGLPLDHLGEQGQPHRDDLAVLGQPGDRLIQERLLVPGQVGRPLGQRPVGPAEGRQDLAGMAQVEEIDQRRCSAPGPGRSPGRA